MDFSAKADYGCVIRKGHAFIAYQFLPFIKKWHRPCRAVIAEGSHPFPFRIRKLSPLASMVLSLNGGGRVERRSASFLLKKPRLLRCSESLRIYRYAVLPRVSHTGLFEQKRNLTFIPNSGIWVGIFFGNF